jgi:transposase-like protein
VARSRGIPPRTATEEKYRKVLGRKRRGETLRALAKRAGIKHRTLSWWSSELRRRDTLRGQDSARETPALVPLQVEGGLGALLSPSYEVQLRGGRVVHVPARFEAATLRTLIAVLEE